MTFVNILPSDDLKLARSKGRVEVSFKHHNGATCLDHLYQSGCGRVQFPSVDRLDMPEAVLINTAGGLTGGDHMAYDITLADCAQATVTGQAAEKIYKSVGPDVTIDTKLTVGTDSYLEWLPQETILFNKARLRRMNSVNLAQASRFLGLEATILGRSAHGETLEDASLTDGWKIRRNGKLVWFDQFRLHGDLDAYRRRPALLGGASAFATILLALPDISGVAESVRGLEADCSSRIGVTSLDETLVIVRVLDADAYSLRRSLVKILTHLRNKLAGADLPMPAVWEV